MQLGELRPTHLSSLNTTLPVSGDNDRTILAKLRKCVPKASRSSFTAASEIIQSLFRHMSLAAKGH